MFIGRDDDLALLAGLWDKRVASLVSCRGRRRVGKSTLIEEFARRTAEHFIAIEGLAPRKGMSDAKQRRNFRDRLAEQMDVSLGSADSWPMAFSLLDSVLPKIGRTVVLLDEISWMGGYDKDFPSYLKAAWDKKLKNHPNLVLVLCGSVSAWIVDNILNSTGFVGRNSLDLEVKELPLRDAIQVIGPTADRMSTTEKLDILSVVGGIPRYLEEFRPSLTLDENIRRMCFLKQGLLFREFDETFNNVFGTRAGRRRAVLGVLASGAATAAEIAMRLGTGINGHLTRTLQELEYAGFVARETNLNAATGKPARIERYRISTTTPGSICISSSKTAPPSPTGSSNSPPWNSSRVGMRNSATNSRISSSTMSATCSRIWVSRSPLCFPPHRMCRGERNGARDARSTF